MAPTTADSPGETDVEARLARLEEELGQARREQAKSASVVVRSIDDLKEALTPSARARGRLPNSGTRSQLNRRVMSRKFVLVLGPGVEELDSFAPSWVEFLQSTTGSKPVREALGKMIPRIINDEGRDPLPSDKEFCIAALTTAIQLGKVKPSDEEEDEEESSTEEGTSDEEETLTGADAKAAAKAAAKRAQARRAERRSRACIQMWDNRMTDEQKEAFMNAFLLANGPIEKQIRAMIAKARGLILNEMLKRLLREKAAGLVPVTDDVRLDGEVYAASKAALPGFEDRARKWPRPCRLICGSDEHGEPQFFYVRPRNEPGVADEPHPFVQFVSAVADECGIAEAHVTAHLVAWLVYMCDQIAAVAPRKRGHPGKGIVRGDFRDHTEWNVGIHKAMKFMRDRTKCPTRAPFIASIQS